MERFNEVELHKLTYYTERELTSLQSQLVCSARTKAAESIKAAKTRIRKGKKASCPQSRLCSIRYDARSALVKLLDGTATLASTSGRQKVELKLQKHHQDRLDWKVCSSDLCLHKNKKLYLHVGVEKGLPVPEVQAVAGVDLGVNHPAVTSTSDFLGEKKWKAIEARYFNLKRGLQAKGTKSAKRHLKKLSQKVNRFRKNCDHVLSKTLATLYVEKTCLVLEDLTNIRERMKGRKNQRRRLHSWSFSRLKFFLSYKAPLYGCSVDFVNPAYTSQKCSCCGHIAKRNRVLAEFHCRKCGFRNNADLNAAKNIRDKYLASRSTSLASGL